MRSSADTRVAQPIVGMFKPNTLISAPCTPRVFDFHTVAKEDIIEFTVDIDFIVAQTSLCHGVSPLPRSHSAELRVM